MNDYSPEDVKKTLDIMGEKAGELIEAGKPVTEMLVAQYQTVHGMKALMSIAVLLVVLYASWEWLKWVKNSWANLYKEDLEILAILSGFILCGLSVGAFVLIAANILRYAAPEYYLLIQMLH